MKFLTSNPAKRIGIKQSKGSLGMGKDADILVFDPGWTLDKVYCKGRLMVSKGKPLVKGTFE